MRFVIDNPKDTIQQYLMKGEFFALDELKIMKEHCCSSPNILDIGSNVGNHAVYFSKFFDANLIYVIEPIPRAYKLLLANLCLNYCHNVNVDYIGLALGEFNCIGYPVMFFGEDNLGATRLFPNELDTGSPKFDPVQVIAGDDIFKSKVIDFIKIDTEGMEIQVLKGLKQTINNNRPNMFVEVLVEHDDEFHEWMVENNYETVWDNHYPGIYGNYMVLPK
jgi:FkbM family methyltransferase